MEGVVCKGSELSCVIVRHGLLALISEAPNKEYTPNKEPGRGSGYRIVGGYMSHFHF